MVTLEGLKGKLLLGLDALLPQLLDLGGENSGGRGGRIDTAGLDGDDDTAANLQEQMGVQANDTGLITETELADCFSPKEQKTAYGWATSAKMQSTMPTSIRYFRG